MSKKIISTVFLFLIFVGFTWWGLTSIFSPGDAEAKIYGLLLLACAAYAGVSILLLPRKRLP